MNPLLVVIFIIAYVYIIEMVWNATIPEIFNVEKISTFQAVKIIVLVSLLTGGGWLKFNF